MRQETRPKIARADWSTSARDVVHDRQADEDAGDSERQYDAEWPPMQAYKVGQDGCGPRKDVIPQLILAASLTLIDPGANNGKRRGDRYESESSEERNGSRPLGTQNHQNHWFRQSEAHRRERKCKKSQCPVRAH